MKRTASARRGLLEINSAVMLFGLAGVLGKLSGLPSPLIVLGRVFFGGAALVLVALALRLRLRPRRIRDIAILLGQGALLAIHWVAFFQAINVSSVAIGLLAFSSFPLFTALLEPLLLRHRPSRIQLVGAALVLPGVYLLAPTISFANSTTVGVLWGVFSGATFALLSVVNRWLGRAYDSVTISLYQDITAFIVLLPALWLVHAAAPLDLRQVLVLVTLGVVCTALAHTLFIGGLRVVTAQLASLIAALEPVWGIIFALALLGEIPSGRTLLGGALILGATLLPGAVYGLRALRWPPSSIQGARRPGEADAR